MPTNPTKSMHHRLAAARQALEGARAEPTIAARLRLVGYGPPRIEEGEALLAGVMLAMQQAEEAGAAQQGATEALRRARARLDGAYRDGAQVARLALGEELPWLARAPYDGSLDALLARSRAFFEGALAGGPEVQRALAEVGLGETALTVGLSLVGAVEQARAAQQARRALLLEAHQVRSNAFETLDDWMRAFATVARVALRDRPALLATLGLMPRGRPRQG